MFSTEVKALQQDSMLPVNSAESPPERNLVHHLSGCRRVTEGELSNDFRLFNGFRDQKVA